MRQQNQSALRWQCRRGMLELDILLNTFLDNQYENLSPHDKQQFKTLLDYPDQTLVDLLLGKMRSSDKEMDILINKVSSNMAMSA